MEYKVCTQCGKKLPVYEFYKKGKRLSSCCKECHKNNIKNTYEEKVDAINEYKAKKGCMKCGEKRFYLLDFHHRDISTKDFNISDKIRVKFSDLLCEIEKCDVLCANCHREFHYLYEKGVVNDYQEWLEFWDSTM